MTHQQLLHDAICRCQQAGWQPRIVRANPGFQKAIRQEFINQGNWYYDHKLPDHLHANEFTFCGVLVRCDLNTNLTTVAVFADTPSFPYDFTNISL